MHEVSTIHVKILCLGALILSGCAVFRSDYKDVPKESDPVKVAVYVGAGARSNGVCFWQSLMTWSPDVAATFVDEKTIAAGALDGVDLLVMPGGSSYIEFDTLHKTGADEKVKAFIRAGGGFLGTCAGNCLVMNAPRRLCVAPYDRFESSDKHGTALLSMTFNDRAKALCGIKPGARKLRYSGGPVLRPAKPVDGASFETIATYDCDLVSAYGTNTVVDSMRGCPAAICGTYGKGRVFAIATHPEYRADTLDLLEKAFRYVAGRPVRLVRPHRSPGDLSVAVFAPGMLGREDADMIAKLVTARGLDVAFMNQPEEIGVGWLDHADVLVLPGGDSVGYKKRYLNGADEFARKFAARGGRVFAYGAGLKHAPSGAVACTSGADLVKKVMDAR